MKRRCVIHPVKAATSSFNTGVARKIQHHLKEAFDLLESLDNDSYDAIDGPSMSDDLDTYIREIDTEIDNYANLVNNM